ncbi:hypothetical protein FIBSPDRAFT_853516 [Athelia psychrophila]|nr:hypothetical protein FIBSPDRAFT_859303 [Fibularhizoctonia sp. CBS 109695]KZP27272.1 hypothetical protein FIBSPDRAFT_853516 [Fibularhizoctonia sp. CBS 109695]
MAPPHSSSSPLIFLASPTRRDSRPAYRCANLLLLLLPGTIHILSLTSAPTGELSAWSVSCAHPPQHWHSRRCSRPRLHPYGGYGLKIDQP